MSLSSAHWSGTSSLLAPRLSPRGFCPVFPPHDSLRRRRSHLPGCHAALPDLPGEQEEADHLPLAAGPLYTQQLLPRTAVVWQGVDHGSFCLPMVRACTRFCHERDHHVVFLKVVPSGEGAGSRDHHEVESRESAWGSHAPPAFSLGCFSGQFCESSRVSSRCRHRELAMSLPYLASLAVGRRAGSAGAMMACMCPTGTCLPVIWQWSPLTIPRCFPRWGWVP